MREVRREAHEIFLSFIIKMSTKLIAIEHELFNPQVERLVSQARVWRESMSLFYELREVVQRFMDQVFSLLRFLQLLSLLSLLPLFRRRAARNGATLQGRYDLNASITVTARTRIFPVQNLMLSPPPPPHPPSLPPSSLPPSLPPALVCVFVCVSICVCVYLCVCSRARAGGGRMRRAIRGAGDGAIGPRTGRPNRAETVSLQRPKSRSLR